MAAVPYLADALLPFIGEANVGYVRNLSARMEVNGTIADVCVHDVSEDGVRITAADHLAVGDEVALTFPGIKKLSVRSCEMAGAVAACV